MPRYSGYDWTTDPLAADPLAAWQKRRTQAPQMGPQPGQALPGATAVTGPTGPDAGVMSNGFTQRLANMQNRFGPDFNWDPSMGPFGQTVSRFARGLGVTGPVGSTGPQGGMVSRGMNGRNR